MDVKPMLALETRALPRERGWRFEPKYDGMRLFGIVSGGRARLLSREGNDKTRQFPEVADALEALYATVQQNFILDGELVSARSDGYGGFQSLLGRIQLQVKHRIRILSQLQPAAFVAFDLLVIGTTPLVSQPLVQRRQELVRLLKGRTGANLRIALHVRDGDRMLAHVVRRSLEGVVAKREDSPYVAGQRLPLWQKYKLTLRQEFVVVGYTDSEKRAGFGALLLAYYAGDRLVYAGSVGSGFSRDALADCRRRLDAADAAFCPFEEIPRGRGDIHWVRPSLVVEVTFEVWTRDGRIRNPRYHCVRTDKQAHEVVRERQEP